jgi:hypothetical protein
MECNDAERKEEAAAVLKAARDGAELPWLDYFQQSLP